MSLTPSELERYDRQIRVFGREGQARLKRGRIVVVGLGGLGCAAVTYLVAAGVGRIVLVDDEKVELSNLNRQVLHWSKDVGRPKASSAAEKLGELNPEVSVEALREEVTERNVEDIVREGDVIVDGTDNWKTRFLLNDSCVEIGKPFVHASVHGLYGQALTVVPGQGPCLRCAVPRPPRERGPFPILGTTAGILGLIQATEAVKLLTGYGKPAVGRLLIYDGYSMEFREVKVRRQEGCPACGRAT